MGINYEVAPGGRRGRRYQEAAKGASTGTPLIEAYAGEPLRVHVLAPWSEQAQVFSWRGRAGRSSRGWRERPAQLRPARRPGVDIDSHRVGGRAGPGRGRLPVRQSSRAIPRGRALGHLPRARAGRGGRGQAPAPLLWRAIVRRRGRPGRPHLADREHRGTSCLGIRGCCFVLAPQVVRTGIVRTL